MYVLYNIYRTLVKSVFVLYVCKHFDIIYNNCTEYFHLSKGSSMFESCVSDICFFWILFKNQGWSNK